MYKTRVGKAEEKMGKLDGQVEHVVFRSEDTGYAVLRVKVRGHKDLVTTVGTVSSVNPGEWLAADGEWITAPQYGAQFKAESAGCQVRTLNICGDVMQGETHVYNEPTRQPTALTMPTYLI